MSNCKDCTFSVFNEQWGEHKCRMYMKTIYSPDKVVSCPHYKKKSEKKESAREEKK